ncbi:protein-tyrosine phosphatase family protein [Desulfovibrio sp. JC010]|uniref:protein-tyrosine phosphatase family protein n=1 Tax=Desulfovibrio sp. JC010 TaxID=2593641 RepID=UPI0013D18601|nr:protein-tyrosine phosphatase family protein [Desulfovibrio sp. JC010]NDV27665.1 hypothetical protein [Desulfovibrio sp. JC010]
MISCQNSGKFALFLMVLCASILICNVPQSVAESYRVTLPGVSNGTYKDYTDVTIWKLENGAIVPNTREYFGGNQPPSDNATNMVLNATYRIMLTSGNMGQNFNCTVNTYSDYLWKIDSACTSPYTAAPCMGCQYLQTPSDNYFHALPITHVNPEEQNYWQAYLLDKTGNATNPNLLFRGPNPTVVKDNEEHFDFPGLLAVLKERYKTQVGDGNFPKEFVFVDISLINSVLSQDPASGNPSNGYVLNAEYRFFNSTVSNSTAIPKADTLITRKNIPLPGGNGTTITGSLLWWNIRPVVEDSQRLKELVSKIATMLDSKNKIPYLIYIHCISGCDRTGDVAISHLLDYRKMNPTDAYNYGTTVFDNQGKQHRLTPHGSTQDPHGAWLLPLIKFCNDTTKSGDNACRTGCDFPAPSKFPPLNYYPWNSTKCDCPNNGKSY